MGNIDSCRIGLYEKALPKGLCWDERLRTAKKCGYDFLEISIDETDERLGRMRWTKAQKEELCKAIADNDMPILTMCLSGNRRYPIGSEDPMTRGKGIALIKDAVDFSVDIGVRIVQLAGYDNYYEPRNQNTQRLFYDALCEVSKYASGQAVMLSIENVDTDFMNTIGKMMKYVRRVNSPWLTVYPDVGNLRAAGLSGPEVADELNSAQAYLTAIHIKDTLPGKIRNIDFGNGHVDFVEIFGALQRIGYQGLFMVEMWTDETKESERKAASAIEFIRGKIAEAVAAELCTDI